MATADPYAVLGVTSTATREEIARAYRALMKRSHPDTGGPASPAEMARITEAWRILGDPLRRARWDQERGLRLGPPTWTAPVVRPGPVRPSQPAAPPSRMDSGWIAAAVVTGIALIVGGIMVGVSLIAGPTPAGVPFVNDELSLYYPDGWSLSETRDLDSDRRVIAHLTSFGIPSGQECLSVVERCAWEGERLPAGGASVQIIAWESVPPPEPNPPDVPDTHVDGRPVAHAQTTVGGEMLSAWWQLSPPGFPDRWIEVRAEIRGGELERSRRMTEIDRILGSIEFGEPSGE